MNRNNNKNIEKGVLMINGVSCDKLAKACGTPLFIYDETLIDMKLQEYQTYFKSDLFNTEIIYASKAFSCKALLYLVKDHGLSVDVVSGGELYSAFQAGISMDKVYFHGNNKAAEELKMALSYGCKTIVLDNLMECEMLIDMAEKQKKEIHVIIRINPGISAHTHKYIVTGDPNSKFGVSIENDKTILKMIQMVSKSEYVSFDGFHCHIGSQIFDLTTYETVIEGMIILIKKLKDIHKIDTRLLNLGGGFGVQYTEEYASKTIKEICNIIITKCESELIKRNMSLEKILIEPGRTIIAEAGNTLYSVGFLKKTYSKSYLFVDGGMTDNIRVALYSAKYQCDLANKMDQKKDKKYTVAGKCCESGDILIEDVLLPEAESKDLLVVYGTGAYGYSMASNYNKIRKPAVVFVKDGKARIVIRGENYSDLMRYETNEEVFI